MNEISANTVLEALRWRYATKQFDPTRKIDAHTWTALEDALVLTPSSFGLQPWKFIVITRQETKEALVPHSWGQRQVADASHVVIFTVKFPFDANDVHEHILRTAEVQGVDASSLEKFEKVVAGFVTNPPYPLDIKAWNSRQVYLALGSFMTTAALLGIDTCPMEGINPAGYDEVLGLKDSGYYTLAACPAGYRAETDKYATTPKVRYLKERVITHIK